ncbi:hypothetical protein EDB85DRAFT_2145815 [Lactarius pseudohatsudake]|nr:hypothetical protein EDB85DRAFT_2145815 [Lactarius pseudohatsudake]
MGGTWLAFANWQRKSWTRGSTLLNRRTTQAILPQFLSWNSGISKQDVRDLVLYIIPDSSPSWIRNTQSVQKHVVLLVQCLISPVISPPLLPTSATENPNPSIPIPLPPDPPPPDPPPPTPPKPPDLLPSVDPAWKQLRRSTAASCSSHARFPNDPSDRTQNKDPAQYLLAIRQMNDYPIPPSIADVPQNQKGG